MSKSAAVITSPILSPAPDLPADERLALVMQDIDRSIKSNITTYLAKKMGGSTVGDVYSKTVKPSHKSEKTAAYEKPWFSRPFTALDDTQKHYLRANIADFVFGKVLTYLDPSCAAKGRIGVVRATSADSAGDKGGVNLYSQEITGFISRHILRWKGGEYGEHRDAIDRQATARFLAQSIFLGDVDLNTTNSGIVIDNEGTAHFKRFDLEFSGSYASNTASCNPIHLEIPSSNFFKYILINRMSGKPYDVENESLISRDFANEARRLLAVNLGHIDLIFTAAYNKINNFIKQYLVRPKDLDQYILRLLNKNWLKANPIDDDKLTVEMLKQRVIEEMGLRIEQMRIWSAFIDKSLQSGITHSNIARELESLELSGDPELIRSLRDVFIDSYCLSTIPSMVRCLIEKKNVYSYMRDVTQPLVPFRIINKEVGVFFLLRDIYNILIRTEAYKDKRTTKFLDKISEKFQIIHDGQTVESFLGQCTEMAGSNELHLAIVNRMKSHAGIISTRGVSHLSFIDMQDDATVTSMSSSPSCSHSSSSSSSSSSEALSFGDKVGECSMVRTALPLTGADKDALEVAASLSALPAALSSSLPSNSSFAMLAKTAAAQWVAKELTRKAEKDSKKRALNSEDDSGNEGDSEDKRGFARALKKNSAGDATKRAVG